MRRLLFTLLVARRLRRALGAGRRRTVRAARHEAALGRLRRAGADRRASAGRASSSPAPARRTRRSRRVARREDRLLGHVPRAPRRHAVRARRSRGLRRRRRPRLRFAVLSPAARPGDRDERALRRVDADAVDADEHALPRERARVGAAAKAKGGASVLLVSSEPYTGGRRRRSGGASWRRWRTSRSRSTSMRRRFTRAGPVLGSRRMRTSMRDSVAKLFADRRPALEARHRARLPDAARQRRPRGTRAGRRLVRGGEAAGARREAGGARARARVDLVVGLGLLQRAGRRPGQARRRLRLAVGARSVALRRASLPERFDRDPRAGQIDLPRDVRCALGASTITTNAIGELARVTRDAESALTVAVRAARRAPVRQGRHEQVPAASAAIVQRRFGGRTAAYRPRSPAPERRSRRPRRDRRRAAPRVDSARLRGRAVGERDRRVLPHLRRGARSARSPAPGRYRASPRRPCSARFPQSSPVRRSSRARRRRRGPTPTARGRRDGRMRRSRASAARATGCPSPARWTSRTGCRSSPSFTSSRGARRRSRRPCPCRLPWRGRAPRRPAGRTRPRRPPAGARRCRPRAGAARRARSAATTTAAWMRRVELLGVGERRLREDHRELVAADAAGDVGVADDLADALGDLGQHRVAGEVADPVVDRLEVVEVEDDQREAPVVALGARGLAREGLVEVAAVVQPGERVEIGLVARLAEAPRILDRGARAQRQLGRRPAARTLAERHPSHVGVDGEVAERLALVGERHRERRLGCGRQASSLGGPSVVARPRSTGAADPSGGPRDRRGRLVAARGRPPPRAARRSRRRRPTDAASTPLQRA